MTSDAQDRVDEFARQAVDMHLPVLIGLMAEDGIDAAEQARRASDLVAMLRNAEIASSLSSNGRPVPLEVDEDDGNRRLVINGGMLEKVEDGALASAMADTFADVLQLSPVVTGLVLQTSEERQMRGLAGQLERQIDAPITALTQIEELVRWRLELFEERLYGLVDGLGGWLEAPVVPRDEFVGYISNFSKRWPQWRDVEDHDYLRTWFEEVDSELSRTRWVDSTDALGEMLWESVAISPRSALRQAAQVLRSLTTDADRRDLLEVLAEVVGREGEPIDGSLTEWPGFQSLLETWEDLWREEDDVIGARRRIRGTPDISVYGPPGESMGFSEPKNLPWDQPLLCWTKRERDGLRDLLGGMEKSLARSREQIRIGRISLEARTERVPPERKKQDCRWIVRAPSKLPKPKSGYSDAVDRAYASLRSAYQVTFSNLDARQKKKSIKLAKGAYGGYMQSKKSIWRRRLSGIKNGSADEAFELLLTGLAEALEWPIFVDPFEGDINLESVSSMPRFTLPVVWYRGADYAPVWIPVETIGESLEQAPLKFRNVAVGKNGDSVHWLGDHTVQLRDLQELSSGDLLRSVHEGALLVTVHRR